MTPEEKIKLLTQALESLLADIKYDGEASVRSINKAEEILKSVK